MTRRALVVVASFVTLAATGILTEGPVANPQYPPFPWPTQCLLLKNHGACVNCCRDAGFPDECGQMCSFPVPNPPPTPDPVP